MSYEMTELDITTDEIRSIRSDGDSWDITESVGATALGVAAARAVETAKDNPLIRDEFAYLLVSSAGPTWAQLASDDMAWLDDDPDGLRVHSMSRDYQAVRTHYFDAYFKTAARDGIRQVVILAAGLDSRAYRLDWPADTVVFEIDQPKVLQYKTATLAAHGAAPTAHRHPVAVDLRDDWAGALAAAGFDREQPTAWLAEGLLPYLPAAAQDRLFETITAQSAPGSMVAVEDFTVDTDDHAAQRRTAWRDRTARMRDRLGLDVDFESLSYRDDDRAEASEWLRDHGWQVEGVGSHDEMARLGRPVPEDLAAESVTSVLLSARLNK
jgi:methyltransferase (TIGR00027 family)